MRVKQSDYVFTFKVNAFMHVCVILFMAPASGGHQHVNH